MPALRPMVFAFALAAGALVPHQADARGRIATIGHASGASWVVADDRLLIRESRGGAWRDITPFPLTSARPDAVAVSADGTYWVVSLAAGPATRYDIYRSDDGGRTWAPSTISSGLGQVGSVTVAPGDRGTAWVLGRRASNTNFADGEIWATTGATATWRRLADPPSSGRLVAATGASLALVGGPSADRLFESDDGARTWRLVADGRAVNERGDTVFGTPVLGAGGWRVAASLRADLAGSLETWSWGPALPRLERRILLESLVSRRRREEAGRWMFPAARVREVLSQLQAAGVTSAREVLLDEQVVAAQVEIASPSEAWVLVRGGTCAAPKQQCLDETTLWATSDGGETFADITPAGAAEVTTQPRDVARSENRGFDKCTAASVPQLQTWWNDSPYRDVNAYIGGVSRGCAQPLLNAAWVRDVFAQGWRIIPTWVGYQAPCTSCTSCRNRFSLDVGEAEAEGVREADRASDTVSALAFPAPTVVYADLEAYASNDVPCRAAVSAFVGGWSRRMRERGHVAGVYGSATNASQDWTGIEHRPDAVWIGKWDLRETVWGLTPLSDTEWSAHQRIHQYRGGHDETWGGVTFNIDNDVEDGPVAAPAGVAIPDSLGPDLVVESPSPDAVLPETRVAVRGSASDAGRGDSGIARVTVNGVTADEGRAAGGDVASWAVEIELPPGSAVLDVEAVDDSAQHNVTRRSVRVTIGTSPGSPVPVPAPSAGLPATPTLIVGDLTEPRDVWLDATHAYWVDAAGRLGQVRLDAGRRVTILDAALESPTAVTGDAGSLFVADARGIWRYRKDLDNDGAFLPAEWLSATAGNVSTLGVAGPFLVYGEWTAGRLVRHELTTNTTAVLALTIEPRALQVVNDRVVWVEGGAAGAVRTVGIDGSDDRQLVAARTSASAWFDDARLLWTEVDEDGVTGRVMAAEHGAGGARTLIDGLRRPAAVRQVGQAVYVSEAMPDGAVWRTRPDGSAAERVVELSAEPMRLVATDTALVWLERASGNPGDGRLVGFSLVPAPGPARSAGGR